MRIVRVTKVLCDFLLVCSRGASGVVHVAVAPESAIPEGMAPASVVRRSCAISMVSCRVTSSALFCCLFYCLLAFLLSHFVELLTCSCLLDY